MTLLVNASPALEVRLVQPWTGVWFADVDMVLDETGIAPSGKVALTLGTQIFAGTVDPRLSGTFANSARLRVVGGAGGWDQAVAARHFHLDAGVLSTVVYSATAAEVGETVVDLNPSSFGQDFVRAAGRASRVLDGQDWYVNPVGVTTVGPRVPIPYDPTSVDVLSWDPLQRVLELAGDDPISPGTIVVDPLQRFSGSLTIRDVEQTWSASGGARVKAWCASSSGTRIQAALAQLVSEKVGLSYLKIYRYRVVLEDATERLTLQIIDRTDGVPDAIPFSCWMGVPGFHAKVLLGSEVLVQFVNGDPTQPVVTGFKAGQYPILLELGAAVSPISLSIGVQAQISALQSQITALEAAVVANALCWTNLIAAAPNPPPGTTVKNDNFDTGGVPGTGPVLAVAAATAATVAVTAGAAAVAAAVAPATSIRMVSD